MNEKFKSLLERLQELKISQHSIGWDENLPEDIWEEIKSNNEGEVDYNLNVDTHRWYELSTSVVKIYDSYLGIRHITNIFSESMDCSDVMHQIGFFEMEEVSTVTYIKKN